MRTQISLLVKAGPHERHYTPMKIELPVSIMRGRLTDATSDSEIPCQVHDGRLHFLLEKLDANCEMRLIFEPEVESSMSGSGINLRHDEERDILEVTIGGQEFTTYHFSPKFPRPFFFPLFGPYGKQITRNYPMVELEGETQDHPHHRSAWVAYGDVNSTDNWIEDGNHGWQTHRKFSYVFPGPVFGGFQQILDWEDHHHCRVMGETRTVLFYDMPNGVRVMDWTLTLNALAQDVRLADTKEGGFCSVRVATSMDGDKGGRIENSLGGIGESECWGKPAHWCDYSGTVEGKQVGVAIFDHPMNLRHPTCWHVRDYGLMTANPFGYSHYQSSLLRDGTYTIAAGSSLTFRYRIYVHEHDARRAGIRSRYHDYVHPPVVEIDEKI